MKTNYFYKTTSVSFICYHFVFCPLYRRKVFDIPGFEDRFKELVTETCEHYGYTILAMECHHDHTHLFLQCYPDDAPADIVKHIKGRSSRALKKEFGHFIRTSALWTRSYFVSTAGNVSAATIQRYVEQQKVRG